MTYSSTPLRILVVDDEPLIRFVLSLVFKKNAEIKVVATAEEALAEVESQFYDLCFLDIILPGMNGLDAMKIINDVSPDTKVAIMTASAVDDVMKEKIDALAFDFIEKPFELSRLQEIARKVCQPA